MMRLIVLAFVCAAAPALAQTTPAPVLNLDNSTTTATAATTARTMAAHAADTPTLTDFGGVGDNGVTDDGPALRRACAWSAAHQRTVEVPGGIYVAKTLDPSGLGAIVLNAAGTNTLGWPTPVCSLRGQSPVNYPDSMTPTTSSTIMLGAGLNRPLLYVGAASADTSWSDLILSGNRSQQTSGAWFPNGLYVIHIADYGSPTFESAIKLNRVVVRDGYNGNLYLGAGRGGLWVRDGWFSYSGQTTSDYAVLLNGYDATFQNTGIGSNAGSGLLLNEGSQYQYTDGAIWMNGADAIIIHGYKVNYSNFQGVNLQWNGCNGVHVLSSPPFAGSTAGIHNYSNMTFDSNSHTTTGICSDFLIDDSTIENIISPGFIGSTTVSDPKPAYSIKLTGTAKATVIAPQFGTGTPYTTAFTNNFGALKGSYNIQPSWTPVLAGTTTPGTPVHTVQAASWSRNNNEITAHFKVQISSLGGAAGNLTITGLPVFSSNVTQNVGSCIIGNADGWTGDAGYSTMIGFVGQNSGTIQLYETGSGKVAQPTPVANYSAALIISGTCFYHTDS